MMLIFIIGRLLASTGTLASDNCNFELSPPSVVVEYGHTLSANCSSPDLKHGMGWESQQGGTGLTTGVSSLTLHIDAVTVWPLAPLCYNNLLDDSTCTKQLPVTVYKTPEAVFLTSQNIQMGPIAEGQTYEMLCEVVLVAPARNLSVYWHKGNKMISKETFDESKLTPVNKSTSLRLFALREDNEAQIWCEAKLEFPTIPTMPSNHQQIIVLFPPTFDKADNETLEVNADSESVLNCTAEGNPAPAYSWHFPAVAQQTEVTQNDSQLRLTRRRPSLGTYTCIASNSQGTRTKYFTVVEARGNRSTFAAIVGVLSFLGVVLLGAGLILVTPDGTIPLNKGSYLRGQPASSGPI